ncbi:MAG: hypothetical protein OXF20_01360 [Gammaproteobacteria bacterium]|nr:hypothetical protein [Gammaproteobacteria bacterium]
MGDLRMQYGKTWKHAPGKVLSGFAVRAGQGLKQRAAREPPVARTMKEVSN